uniref:Uncharacterized protein n=1 Tax=Vitis vinifera TaxID=29760 RepID=A5B0Y8_VITVI|nr:hypothetical protein VITISV_043965 [Vitis vinifera]
MEKTRGGLSASPSSSMPQPEQSAIGGATLPPAQDSTVPPSEGGTPSQRRYPTRRPPTDLVPPAAKAKRPASRPPAKKTKFSSPGEPSQTPQAKPPTEDSQIPMGIPLETVIRRPMIRYHMEHLLTPRQFYYPRVVLDFYQSMTTRGVRNPTLIHFTMDGRQGAIGARHIAEALRIPYEPVTQADFREWSSFSQRDMHLGYPGEPRLERCRHYREDFSLEKWHHLAAYFAPQGAPAVPPPQEAPDVPPPPELPQDEQLPQAQQDEILTDTTPPAPTAHTSVHMPEATLPVSPITQPALPVVPATSAPPPSSEPTVTVSLTEFRGLVHSLQILSTAGFSYPADGHYSCTPGSDHGYSDPAYHDPSSDPAASEYSDTSWA